MILCRLFGDPANPSGLPSTAAAAVTLDVSSDAPMDMLSQEDQEILQVLHAHIYMHTLPVLRIHASACWYVHS